MVGEEMTNEISDRRRSKAGLNLNVNFNGGGVVLLIGAAAGALFASAFAAYRIRAYKMRRGSMTDGIQGGSNEHLASHEAKEFVGDEGGEGDGANAEEGVVQVISHESFDASAQISQFDKKEMDFYLLEEGKKEVRERSLTAEIELVDGDHGKLVGCRDSNADISSCPANACGDLGIGNSFGENQIRCDDEELVAASIKEERKTSFINCKEDDEENKKAYLEEWGEGEEIEENLTSSNLYSEQPRLIEIGSSPTNVYYNLGLDSNLGEDQLRHGNKQLVIDSDSEVGEAPCKYSKEDEEEDTKKAYIQEWSEGGELEEKITSNPNTEELHLLESCVRDNPAMIIAVKEKAQLEDNTTDVIQDGKAEENLLNGFEEDVESSETEKNRRENEECPLTEYQRIEFSLELDKIQFQGIEPIAREEKKCLEDWRPLSLEPNIEVVQPIQLDNNLSNSKKTLEREECYLEAGAEELGTALNEEVDEREDETNSVQYHELETRQYIEIHKEPQSQITEEEDEEDQNLKLCFDLVEKGAKIVAKTIKQDTKTELIDVDKKHQRQVEGHENIVSSKGKQQRSATKKVKGIECTFMGYSNGHIFLVTTLATAFAILAFLFEIFISG